MLTARITLGHDLRFLFTFLLQVCFGAIYDMNLRFYSYSATSCEYDNVEVEEKSVVCHAP